MADKIWAGARVHLTEVDPGTGALCGNVGVHVGDAPSLVRARLRPRWGVMLSGWIKLTRLVSSSCGYAAACPGAWIASMRLIGQLRGSGVPSMRTALSSMPAAARMRLLSPCRPLTVCPLSSLPRPGRSSPLFTRAGAGSSEGYSRAPLSAYAPSLMVLLKRLLVRLSVDAATRFPQTWPRRVRG